MVCLFFSSRKYLLLHFFRKRIRMISIKYLITNHHRHQILCLRQINNIMGPTRNHINCFYFLSTDFKLNHLSGINIPLLYESVSRSNDKHLSLTIMPVLSFRNTGSTDIHTDLSSILCMQQFRTSIVYHIIQIICHCIAKGRDSRIIIRPATSISHS